MKVIFLSDYRESSANYNIAAKIANKMKAEDIELIKGYYVTDSGFFTREKADDKEFIIQSGKTYAYLKAGYSKEWSDKGALKKIAYLLTHPKFFISAIAYFFERKQGFVACRNRIKEICESEKIDFIVGVSFPIQIEKLLARLNVSVPIYAVRLDPYAFNPCIPNISFEKRIKEERKIIKRIDKLFTTNLIIRDLLTDDVIKNYSSKMNVIEFPLISKEDCEHGENRPYSRLFEEDGSTYILHAGTFYRDIRNPKKLVDLIKVLPGEYKLCVAGYNSSMIREYDEEVRDRIIDMGCLDRQTVQSAVNDCDFLLSYNNLNTNMVPSKLFECVDSGKPFINLCQSTECPTIDYVKDYDMAYTAITDDIHPEELIRFMERTKGRLSSREEILKSFYKCTVEYVVDQIMAVE